MPQRNSLRYSGRGAMLLMLAWAVCSLSVLADDARPMFDRTADRDWTDVDGNTITGRFSGVIRDEVLINARGAVQRVKLSTLSQADIAWIWGLHNQEGKLNQLPPEYREEPVISAPAETPDESQSEQPMPDQAGAPAPSTTPADAPMTTAPAAPMGGGQPSDPDGGRTWTVNGNPIQGKFSGVIGTEILINVNNRVQRFRLSELSDYDLAWLWDVYNALGKLDDLPVDYRVRPENPMPPDGSAPSSIAGGDASTGPSTDSSVSLRDTRTWTDREGNTIQGSFTSIRGEQVSIFRGHGVGWQDVHLAQLARNDLIWLQNALQVEGRLSDLPLVFRDPPDASVSDSELVRQRRQGGMRQWKLYNGQTFVGAFHRVSEGIVQVYDNQNALREEHWNDLSDEDHEYLKGRLGRETPAEFFPAQRDLIMSPEQQSANMRVWTDRERNQIVGSFSHLEAMNTVAVFNTSDGEARYIYEYIHGDDQAVIQGVTEQQRQTQIAQQGASGGTYSSSGPGYGSSGPGYGSSFPSGGPASSGYPGVDSGFRTQNRAMAALEEMRNRHLEQLNADDLYCPDCGTTFKSGENGMHFGAECPVCRQREEQARGAQQTSSTSSLPMQGFQPPGSMVNRPSADDHARAYQEGRAWGEMTGRAVWGVIGVVCLIMLIRKVSR